MRAFLRNFAIGGITAALALVGMVFLPHDRYIRWQAMQTESYARLGWIYERIHFDPTPIDIAFIGTSHTMNGIDASAVGEKIAEVANSSGSHAQPLHVVNFAIPMYGRNLHWLIVRELLENRKVGMLVLEIFENETRKSHPLFVYPAEVSDVLDAPMFVNFNYFPRYRASAISAIVVVRQNSMAKPIWASEAISIQKHYDGSTVDNTRFVQVHGKALTPIRDRRLDPAKLGSGSTIACKREKSAHAG